MKTQKRKIFLEREKRNMAPNIMDNGTGDNMIGQVFGVSGPVIIAERMAGQ